MRHGRSERTEFGQSRLQLYFALALRGQLCQFDLTRRIGQNRTEQLRKMALTRRCFVKAQ